MQSKGAFEMRQKLKKQQGFTIIETMIVLAIAGLIMLIVFLAVPALQRSTRNTQRKNDAGNALTAIGTYVSNNNGALPYNSTTLSAAIKGIHLGYYSPTNVFYDGGSSGGIATGPSSMPTICGGGSSGVGTVGTSGCTPSATLLTTESMIFIPDTVCVSNKPTSTNATSRSYTLIYAVETAANVSQEQCIGS